MKTKPSKFCSIKCTRKYWGDKKKKLNAMKKQRKKKNQGTKMADDRRLPTKQ